MIPGFDPQTIHCPQEGHDIFGNHFVLTGDAYGMVRPKTATEVMIERESFWSEGEAERYREIYNTMMDNIRNSRFPIYFSGGTDDIAEFNEVERIEIDPKNIRFTKGFDVSEEMINAQTNRSKNR